jgi:tocopherol cyclase-like protein
MGNLKDNSCRWDGSATGHHESWFLMLNERALGRGFWFRYSLDSPAARRGLLHSSKAGSDRKPCAALWAAVFDTSSPEKSFGLRHQYDIRQFESLARQEFSVRICEARLEAGRATGQVEGDGHSIAWDLSFTPDTRTYHHITPSLKLLARPSMFVCSPNIDARFNGTILIDGHQSVVEDAAGCQSHLWGRKHIDEWIWAHANSFESHPRTVFEGLAARQRRAGRLLPPVQSLFLRHRGEENHFVRVRFAEQWRRNLGIAFWAFSAMNTQLYIEGTAQCRLRDMLQSASADPDGEAIYCSNTEVASLKIRLFRRVRGVRWRHVETIKSRSSAHLEHASRQADPQVRRAFL